MTVPCAFAGLAAGATYFGGLETDPTQLIMVCGAYSLWNLLMTKLAGY